MESILSFICLLVFSAIALFVIGGAWWVILSLFKLKDEQW